MKRLFLLFIAATALAGCGGGGLLFLGPQVRLVNGDSGLQAINGSIGGVLILSVAEFGQFSGYTEVDSQSPLLRYTQPGTGSELLTQRENFNIDGHFTIIDISAGSTSIEALTFLDDRARPPAGQSSIRVINASPELNSTVDVYLTDAPNPEPTSANASVAFRGTTGNLTIGPGNVEVQVRRVADGAIVFDGTVTVVAGQLKTVVLADKGAASVTGIVLTDR